MIIVYKYYYCAIRRVVFILKIVAAAAVLAHNILISDLKSLLRFLKYTSCIIYIPVQFNRFIKF